MNVSSLQLYLVDDDPAAHIFHEVMIKDAGIGKEQYSTYLDPKQALKDLKTLAQSDASQVPDVILLDLNMPVISGWDFVDIFANINFSKRRPKIYLVTNSENPGDFERVQSTEFIVAIKAKFLDKAFFEELVLQHLPG